MTDRSITLDDVLAGKLRENGHINYGEDDTGYPMQHTTIARLSCIDRHYKGRAREKAGVASVRRWYVDGAPVVSLEEAIERLNVPPAFTDEERFFLAKVPTDWTELHPFLRAMELKDVPLGSAYGLMFRLRHKGAVEVEHREAEKLSVIRRTPTDALTPAAEPAASDEGPIQAIREGHRQRHRRNHRRALRRARPRALT